MPKRFHSYRKFVCYLDETGAMRRENALTPARFEFVTGRLKQRDLEWWIERRYYSL